MFKRISILMLTSVLALSACSDDDAPAPAASSTGTLLPTQIVGITEDLKLVQFSPATSTNTSAPLAITGLVLGNPTNSNVAVAMDYRPSNGLLYLLAGEISLGTDTVYRLYTVNTATGVATLRGTAPLGNADIRGMAFNPVTDQLRLVGIGGVNFRISPEDASLVARDTDLAYVAGDTNAAQIPGSVGIGYIIDGTATTTAFIADTSQDVLARLGSAGGSPDSPGTGKLTTVGPFNTSVGGFASTFDIEAGPLNPSSGSAAAGYLLDVTSNGATPPVLSSNLYRANLITGELVLLGQIGNNTRFAGITVVPGTGSNGISSGSSGGGTSRPPVPIPGGGIVGGDALCSSFIGGIGVSSPVITKSSEPQNLGCTLCNVTNVNNLIDANPTNFSTVEVPLGLLQGEISVTVSAPSGITFPAGNIAGATFAIPGQVLGAGVLSNLSVTTMLGGVDQESVGATGTLLLEILGQPVIPNGNKFFLGGITTMPFDAVRISFNVGLATASVGNLLTTILGQAPRDQLDPLLIELNQFLTDPMLDPLDPLLNPVLGPLLGNPMLDPTLNAILDQIIIPVRGFLEENPIQVFGACANAPSTENGPSNTPSFSF